MEGSAIWLIQSWARGAEPRVQVAVLGHVHSTNLPCYMGWRMYVYAWLHMLLLTTYNCCEQLMNISWTLHSITIIYTLHWRERCSLRYNSLTIYVHHASPVTWLPIIVGVYSYHTCCQRQPQCMSSVHTCTGTHAQDVHPDTISWCHDMSM